MAKSLPIESKHVESFEVNAEDVVIIGRDTKDGPEHCCWRDDACRPASMMDTLVEEGQLQEALGRKAFVRDPKTNALVERVEIIFGVDRTASIREVNKTHKPSERMKLRIRLVPKGTTDEEIVAMIEAENARRKKDASPIRKAESAKRMLKFKIPEETILRVQGLTKIESVKRSLDLLELAPGLRKAVDDRIIKPSVALAATSLPHDEQEQKAAEWTAAPESAPAAKEVARQVKEQKQAPEQRSKPEEGEVGPPSKHTLNRTLKKLKALQEAKKPLPVSDHFHDTLLALLTDEPTNGSLPADVYAALRWLKSGKGVSKIKGLTELLGTEK